MLRIAKGRSSIVISQFQSSKSIKTAYGMRLLSSQQSEFVEIGDIKVPINVPKNPELVPSGNLHYWGKDLDNAPAEVIGHLRWMAQKSLLGQDIFLTGPPTANRRRLILSLAELCGWECEYLMITKDTTEADLKQRREIVGDSVVWCDAAPVRAAINGRVLIIDGMENAERNVLPTINNLLENREMMLEDGRFLMKGDTVEKLTKDDEALHGADLTTQTNRSARLIPVHPAFRVVALGLPVPPYHGRVLDPPLRSRFQSRFIDELGLDDALNCVDTHGFSSSASAASKASTGGGPRERLTAVAGVYEGLRSMRAEAIRDGSGAAAVPCFSVDGLRHCLNLLRTAGHSDSASTGVGAVSVANALSRSLPLGYTWRAQQGSHNSDIALGGSLSQKHKTMLQAMMEKVRKMQVQPDATVSVSPSAGISVAEALQSATEKLAATAQGITGVQSLPYHQLTAQQATALAEIRQDLSLGRNVCLLGGKGCGKSFLLTQISALDRRELLVFPVFQEMSGRDLLQRRGTAATTTTSDNTAAANASSLWLDSPLTKAARSGQLCVLDGIDRIDSQALMAIRSLVSSPTYHTYEGMSGGEIEARSIDLPSGERLQVHPDFRLVALGAPPTKSDDARMRYLNSDLNVSYHLLPELAAADIARILHKNTASAIAKSTQESGHQHADVMEKQLQQVDRQIITAVNALHQTAGKQHPELRPSLRHALRIQSTLRTMLSNSSTTSYSAEEIGAVVHKLISQALLVRFLSAASATKFDIALNSAGLHAPNTRSAKSSNKLMKMFHKQTSRKDIDREIIVDSAHNTVTIGDVTVQQRHSTMPELVPHPLFHANASHLAVLESLLLSYKASYENKEKAILLIGNQGVGKNKLVDRLLQVQ